MKFSLDTSMPHAPMPSSNQSLPALFPLLFLLISVSLC